MLMQRDLAVALGLDRSRRDTRRAEMLQSAGWKANPLDAWATSKFGVGFFEELDLNCRNWTHGDKEHNKGERRHMRANANGCR